jgi:hypothetical protein
VFIADTSTLRYEVYCSCGVIPIKYLVILCNSKLFRGYP